MCEAAATDAPSHTVPPQREPRSAGIVPEEYWLKTVDPAAALPASVGDDADLRVMLPDDDRFTALRDRLRARGATVRSVKYWMEQEQIHRAAEEAGNTLTAHSWPVTYPARPSRDTTAVLRSGAAASVARDAFDLLWHAQEPVIAADDDTVPTDSLLPAGWDRYLPHKSLNPAQAQAVPAVLNGSGHVLVVAPTGSGKTTIGMVAALRAVLGEGRKAVWLVPQRSLTDELHQELQLWRTRGLRVERLSGEYGVDMERARQADLWVTTTEKFEVLCRTASLRETLAEVGCLIVDEVHLLGDPERGPVLEALLARVREREHGADAPLRVVGLSATVSNADQIADWLGARLVRINWRPTRLTWQLPTVPAHPDPSVTQAARTRLTNSIVQRVTADGGSVLVFCGSKYGVRTTALALAAARGVNTNGVRPDDVERVYAVTRAAGIGLHYKDWEHKRDAEQAFRARELDVLVATSTVAAGVNLPARAVIVRDTRVGHREVEVATVQQMFGRAGRLGAGEQDGWAYLLVDQAEHAIWQERLVAGYTVESQISSSLPDQVLAEVVQGRIRTFAQAQEWWRHTFAHHRGSRGDSELRTAFGFLTGADYLTADSARADAEGDDDSTFTATELGTMTTRVMVPTVTGHRLRTALAAVPLPAHPEDAEHALIGLLATLVPKLARAACAESYKAAVGAVVQADGHLSRVAAAQPGPAYSHRPGDLARAALLLAANSPRALARSHGLVAGVPYAAFRPALDHAPRYLHWLASQGFWGSVHPWAAITAADLGRRVRWRRCAPPRGSGRLLWMCEQMATAAHLDEDVPALWSAARERAITSPDWPTPVPPHACRLDGPGYAALLRERVSGAEQVEAGPEFARVSCAAGRALTVWTGQEHRRIEVRGRAAESRYPALGAGPPGEGRGAALFSWRGDYRASGWLSAYTRLSPAPPARG